MRTPFGAIGWFEFIDTVSNTKIALSMCDIAPATSALYEQARASVCGVGVAPSEYYEPQTSIRLHGKLAHGSVTQARSNKYFEIRFGLTPIATYIFHITLIGAQVHWFYLILG